MKVFFNKFPNLLGFYYLFKRDSKILITMMFNALNNTYLQLVGDVSFHDLMTRPKNYNYCNDSNHCTESRNVGSEYMNLVS